MVCLNVALDPTCSATEDESDDDNLSDDLPVHLPVVSLSQRQLTEKYGLKDHEEIRSLTKEIEEYINWNMKDVQLDRMSPALQTTTLNKHEDHIRGE